MVRKAIPPKRRIEIPGVEPRDLNIAMRHVKQDQEKALAHAIKAGELVHTVKQYLKEHPEILQNFKTWFAHNCPGYKLRAAHNYEICYKQSLVDSTVCYPSISACIRAYKKNNPPRQRFQPSQEVVTASTRLAEASRHLISTQDTPELPPVQKVAIGSAASWLDDENLISAMGIALRFLRQIEDEDAQRAAKVFSAYVTGRDRKSG